MFGMIGIAVLLVMVFGGYVLAGGHLGIILKALPFEMIMIGGAAVGSFLISNDLSTVKHTLADIKKVFKGPQWQTGDYRGARQSRRAGRAYRKPQGQRDLRPLPPHPI
jgi:chemotaxis protein MotA